MLKWHINLSQFPLLNPETLDHVVSQFRQGQGETIKDRPRRTVKRMSINGVGAVVVKHTKVLGLQETLKHLFLPRRITAEWRIMNQLCRLGIPAPDPVALGTVRKGGILREAFLVTKSSGEMVTLNDYYRQMTARHSLLTEAGCKSIIVPQLAEFMSFLHRNGIIHHDIHIENILLSPSAVTPLVFYLIDVYKLQIMRNPDEKDRFLNLARILFSASESQVFSTEDQIEFLRTYYAHDHLSDAAVRASAEKVFRLVGKLSRERVRSRGRKSFKPGKFFATLSEAGKFLIRRHEFPGDKIQPVLDQHQATTRPIYHLAHPHPGKLPPGVLKASRRSLVTKISLGDPPEQPYCVKEERNDPEHPSLRFFLTRSRNRRSWVNSNKMVLRRLPAPRCLALQEEQYLGLRVRSFLIMEYIEDALPLNNYLLKTFHGQTSQSLFKKKMALISFLADFLRRLHEKGIYQGDLKSNNLLIREIGCDRWECFVVDLDCIRFGKKVTLSRRVKNLAQLNASVADCISPSNRIKFMKEYDVSHQWDRHARKALYRKILALCRKRKTHFYGVRFDDTSHRFVGNVKGA